MSIWKKQARVYLDVAAGAPPCARALRTFHEAAKVYGNPSSPHLDGVEASLLLEESRGRIAKLAEVKTDAVIFTGSATEANALGLLGYIQAYANVHVLYAPGAHSSITQNVEMLQSKGVAIEALTYKNGELDLEALSKQVRENTKLVAVSAVCGETGAITPVRDIRRVLDKAHSGIVLLVDASQLPLVGAYELTRLGATMITLDAQKVGGVRGIGALIAPRRIPLTPLYGGGGQERGLRSGTPSPALAAAFAEALTEAGENREKFLQHSRRLRAALLAEIASIPHMVVNEGGEQAPHIVNISLIGRDTDYLVLLLDEAGFAVSTRSACETDALGSRAVYAMTGSRERASSTLRISWGPETAAREIRAFAKALIRGVKFLDTAGIL